MTDTGGLLQRLIEAGTPATLVADVALALARGQADKEAIEGRRSRDRDRQANRRLSRDITLEPVTPCDNADEPPSLDKEIPPRPPKEINPNPARIALARKAAGFGPPSGVGLPLWNTFCQQRKKALSSVAYDRLCLKLGECGDAGWPPGEMIGKAVERGWETVFVPTEKRNGHRNGTNNASGPGRTERAALSFIGIPEHADGGPQAETLRRIGPSRGANGFITGDPH